jgi:hypothetical protein
MLWKTLQMLLLNMAIFSMLTDGNSLHLIDQNLIPEVPHSLQLPLVVFEAANTPSYSQK